MNKKSLATSMKAIFKLDEGSSIFLLGLTSLISEYGSNAK